MKTTNSWKKDESVEVDPSHKNELKCEHVFDIDFEGIGLKLKNGKTIMHGVTGSFKNGRSCAIMGPSGAGKTTIMSLVTGKAKKTHGMIKVNGVEEDLYKCRKLVGVCATRRCDASQAVCEGQLDIFCQHASSQCLHTW